MDTGYHRVLVKYNGLIECIIYNTKYTEGKGEYYEKHLTFNVKILYTVC